METRITNHLDEYLAAIDERLRHVLGDLYAALPEEQRQSVRQVFVDSVHDVIQLAKRGKNVHERFVQNVVLNAIDPIIGLDNEDCIFFWNRGAETTFGYSREEVTGKHFRLLMPDDLDHEREFAFINQELARVGYVRNHQTRRRTRDGRVLVVSLSRTVVRDEHDQPLGSLAILRDMTEVKQLERQVAQNEKLALIGQIAAGIAHEIGTPLNIISGISEVLLLDREAEHPEREDLETIIGQTDRITKLVRDLLSFARPQPLRPEPIHLVDELRLAVSLLKGRLDKLGIVVEYELHDIPDVVADHNQIQQVFLNLLVNACDAFADHPSDDPRRIRVTSHVRPEDGDHGRIHLHLIDNGPGIPPELHRRIFEPFVTTKEVGKGTGLGLAVCRRIIEDHGGSIDVSSSPDGGADFAIRFPLHGEGSGR